MRPNKIILTLMTAILAISLVYAATFTLSPTTVQFSDSQLSNNITLTNQNAPTLATFNFAIAPIIDTDGRQVTFQPISSATVNSTETITLQVDSADSNLEIGRYSTDLIVTDTADANNTMSVIVNYQKSYCEDGPLNISNLYIKDMDESGSSSDDDWTWFPQDTITLNVEVRNAGDDDLDTTVEWDIYDKTDNDFLDIGDNKDISVNDRDTEEVEFTFDVPHDLEKSSDRYVLYVKVFEEGAEDSYCSSVNENGRSNQDTDEEGIPLEIDREKNDVRITNSNVPDVLSCGSSGEVDLYMSNIGRQREDKVRVTLESTDINDEIVRTITNLDEDDKAERISFPIEVPQDAEEGDYRLKFEIEFDYDKDDDTYSDTETVTLTDKIQVTGNCVSGKSASISAFLESDEVVEGGEMIVTATVTNTGTTSTSYTFVTEGYDSWAEEKEVSERIFTLDAGDSKVVTMTFNLKEDSAGDHTFKIKVLYDNESTEQPVTVTVSKAGSDLGGLGDLFEGNGFIWAIIIVNVILVLIIIIVIVRISRE
ncbi:MAG: putative S-layer protein [Nanoarchaeota archaeon]|nr:putative S-layer protein [Nanoarchaeota archaeon]